ncbi:MAG: hypothetical protein ABSB35_23255 [Bryobacteraceae bacterium]
MEVQQVQESAGVTNGHEAITNAAAIQPARSEPYLEDSSEEFVWWVRNLEQFKA